MFLSIRVKLKLAIQRQLILNFGALPYLMLWLNSSSIRKANRLIVSKLKVKLLIKIRCPKMINISSKINGTVKLSWRHRWLFLVAGMAAHSLSKHVDQTCWKLCHSEDLPIWCNKQWLMTCWDITKHYWSGQTKYVILMIWTKMLSTLGMMRLTAKKKDNWKSLNRHSFQFSKNKRVACHWLKCPNTSRRKCPLTLTFSHLVFRNWRISFCKWKTKSKLISRDKIILMHLW